MKLLEGLRRKNSRLSAELVAISDDLKLFPKLFIVKKSQEKHLLHGPVETVPSSNPRVAETQTLLLSSWYGKLAFSEVSSKSGLTNI